MRKGPCPDCGLGAWLVYDDRGALFGCRDTYSEAISNATYKARILSRKVSS